MQLTVHPSQSLRIAMLLSLLGGYLDSFSLISFSGHLASLQSGNLIFMGINILAGKFIIALTFLLPVICFILGAGTNYLFRHHFSNQAQYLWQEISLLVELLGFTLLAFIAPGINQHILIAALAFLAAIQADTSTDVHGKIYTSIMSTGNLKTFGSSFAQFLITKDREHLESTLHFGAIISAFFIGAVFAALGTTYFGLRALFGLPIFLVLALYLTRKNINLHHPDSN